MSKCHIVENLMHWLKCKFKNAVSVSEVLVSLKLSSEGYLTSIPNPWRLSYLNHIVKINIMFKISKYLNKN